MTKDNRIKIIRACTASRSLSFVKGMLPDLRKKYEVLLLSSPGEQMDAVTKQYGVKGIPIQMERHISLFKDLKALIKTIGVFCREKPTMVHSMTPKAGLLCMIAGWLTRVPVRVHTFTGLVWPTSSGPKRKVLMLTDKLTCACATHIIPEGEGVKSDLIAGKITKKPLKVLGFGNVMGVDMIRFSRRPEVMKIVTQKALKSHDCFTFLTIGRIVRDKGINEMIAAFLRLQETNKNVRLILIGDYEDKLDPISEETRKAIHDNTGIEAVGRKTGDELLAYYAAADCYVSASYREGFPNTVLEAGAMDLPCIVTDINGSREIIKNGVNGMIVEPQNEEALYRAMNIMLTSKIDRENMAGRARKMIADRFEQGFVRKCLYDFYDKVLDSPKLKEKGEQLNELQQLNTET